MKIEKRSGSTAVTEQTTLDFAADAGAGMEGADRAAFAIPFLMVLQANSPQLETLPNARAGMFMNSVTNAVYPEAVDVVPVAFQRRYLAWAPREQGAGFRGEHSAAVVEGPENELKWVRDADGRMVLPDGSILRDTRNHFVLVLDAAGPQQALISLSSTQIKKSRKWMSRMQAIQLKDARGQYYTPPSFSHVYRLTTVTEENDKGKWKGVNIELLGPVTDPDVYTAAKAFHTLIAAGKVQAAPPPPTERGGEEQF